MKSKLFEFFFKLMLAFVKILNFNKPKVFIYTDSRGYDVIGKFGKNPFNSYFKYLISDFNVTLFLCKEKHTTIPDFLGEIKKHDLTKFKHVLLHCGVVDFSPRPISNLDWVLKSKANNSYFNNAESICGDYYRTPSDVIYNGEKTQNLYSPIFLKTIIIPELKNIDNLIWINSNHFVKGWEGNFSKGRPLNIEENVSLFDLIMMESLDNIIDLKKWSDQEIKDYTIDNIHFTKKGFQELERLLKQKTR